MGYVDSLPNYKILDELYKYFVVFFFPVRSQLSVHNYYNENFETKNFRPIRFYFIFYLIFHNFKQGYRKFGKNKSIIIGLTTTMRWLKVWYSIWSYSYPHQKNKIKNKN